MVKKNKSARDCSMCDLYRSGKTLEEVGKIHGVTRERVRQVLSGYDITRFDGGNHVKGLEKLRINDKRRKVKAEARAAKYGVTLAQFRAIRAEIGIENIQRYQELRWHVVAGSGGFKKTRFEITLAEYVEIWKAAGIQLHQKGYRFGRKDYSKAFTLDNVEIVTARAFGQRLAREHGFIAHPENTYSAPSHKIAAWRKKAAWLKKAALQKP